MLIRVVGAMNIAVGVISLIAPAKFYSFAMKLFTPDVAPPFSQSAIHVTTLFLLLPSFVLIANGIALIAVSYYLEGPVKAPVVIRESEESFVEDLEEQAGYSLESFESSEVRHEYIGMEVYDRRGNYYGKVEDVTLDNDGRLIEFYARRGSNKNRFRADEIERADEVILVGIR